MSDSKNTSPPASLPQLDFPQPPQMPTFFELVDAPTSSEAQRPKGLFETLLGARVEVLFEDAEAHPEKYHEEALALLANVVAGNKRFETLSLAEQYLLDQATIDFATKTTPPKVSQESVKAASREVEQIEEEEDMDEGMEEVVFEEEPEAALRPFWWR